jgi:hypothetical protein
MMRGLPALAAGAAVAALLMLGAAGCLRRETAGGPVRGDTLFAEDFESGTLAAWQDGVDSVRHHVRADPAFAHSGSHYLAATYVAAGDGGWLTRFLLPGHDSLYVSYWVRLPQGWVGGTKLIALYGSRTDDRWSAFGKAGTCPDGTDFFAAMLITEAAGNPGPARFYTYYPAMGREPDGVTCWGRFGDGTERYSPPLTLTPGAWHHVELWVKLNAPGEDNAAEQFWIDGVERGRWAGFSVRSSAVLTLDAVQLTFNRGISGGPVQQELYVDDVVVLNRRP